jgi:hypothetical protein
LTKEKFHKVNPHVKFTSKLCPGKGLACFTSIEELFAQEKPNNMLHRKIYQLCCDGREVCVFLRDQQRWIERARIVDIEGDLVTIRYETRKKMKSVPGKKWFAWKALVL